MQIADSLPAKLKLSAHMYPKTSEAANILIYGIIYSGSNAQMWLFHTFLITWLTKVPWGHMLFLAPSWILHKLRLPPHKHPSIPTSEWVNFPANRRHLRENSPDQSEESLKVWNTYCIWILHVCWNYWCAYVCVCVFLNSRPWGTRCQWGKTADEKTAASSDPHQRWS